MSADLGVELPTPSAGGGVPALDLLGRLARGREECLAHVEVLPPREESPAAYPGWVTPTVRTAFEGRGIDHLWEHQARAAEAAWAGTHVVLATGTASGKSLGFQLPALTALTSPRDRPAGRSATVLYLAPTKALAQDQLAGLEGLGLETRFATSDGDSSREHKEWARDHGEYVLTNPDFVHHSLLPRHERWAPFLSALRFVVIDECHHYRGVFGGHVAQVLRRLRRVCAAYGASPTFVLASATVAQPEVTAARLVGVPVRAVIADASPRGQVVVGFWQPEILGFRGERRAPVRRSADGEVATLLADLVADQVRTLAFVRSRPAAERVARQAEELLADRRPDLAPRVAAYRGGYLPEERRDLEAALRSGALTGLSATNALELGIDIAGLDAVLVAGFPGTRTALWQQVGRAGRRGREAVGLLVARDDPLDTYLVHHPEAVVGLPVEATVLDPDNPHVLGPHLCAAAAELPLSVADLDHFGPNAPAVVDALTVAGLLRRRPQGWFWADRRRASALADLRSTGGASAQLVESETGRVVGTVDACRVQTSAHPGAVYVHRGETWLVESLDPEETVAGIRRTDPGYTTVARQVAQLRVIEERSGRSAGSGRSLLGEVEVARQVVGFLRLLPSGDVVGDEPLDLPPWTMRTPAVWWTWDEVALRAAGLGPRRLPGAVHAVEHCLLGLLPLFAGCDRWDVGGVSAAGHPHTGGPAVFVHDGHPGGAGFAERGFDASDAWLRAARETVARCPCQAGCPSCIQSPTCGSQNSPLDKPGALVMLDGLLTAPTAADG